MRQRYGERLAHVEGLADAVCQRPDPEQLLRCEDPDRHDQSGVQQAKLPLAPEPAELLLARRGSAVAAARRRPAGVAAHDRGAVEEPVEAVLVELKPLPERLAGATTPRPPLDRFHRSRRLAEDVGALARPALENGPRLEWKAGLGARPADTVVTLERVERAVAGAANRH